MKTLGSWILMFVLIFLGFGEFYQQEKVGAFNVGAVLAALTVSSGIFFFVLTVVFSSQEWTKKELNNLREEFKKLQEDK